MNLVPLDKYIRCVLGIKQQATKLQKMDEPSHRSIGHSISKDVNVLINNLKENGHI